MGEGKMSEVASQLTTMADCRNSQDPLDFTDVSQLPNSPMDVEGGIFEGVTVTGKGSKYTGESMPVVKKEPMVTITRCSSIITNADNTTSYAIC